MELNSKTLSKMTVKEVVTGYLHFDYPDDDNPIKKSFDEPLPPSELKTAGFHLSIPKKEEQLLETLDPGESQALAVAEDIDGTVVTDDGDARATAKQRDIDLTGSIGLLVRFVEDQQISVQEADQCLKQWIDEGGSRSPARDFEAFLEE